MPEVSVGLPVFNGANYLREALDSILAQTYSDFELILSDNASTDGTEEICRAYAARDRRIRYDRSEKNLGAARNFNRAFELSSGKYFKWAAHDDVCAPDFLARCVEALERDASVVLCYPRARVIDGRGVVLEDYGVKLNTDSPDPQVRFRGPILVWHRCYEIFGVIRASTLRRTSLMGHYAASDRVLLGELALHGRFQEVPEHLFFARRHPQQSVKALPTNHLRTVWFDPSQEGRVVFPEWRIFHGCLRSIRKAPLSWRERVSCYLHVGRWVRGHWRRLARDLIAAVRQISGFLFRPIGAERPL
ncbi:MAG: hypothetical protein A3F84_14865 [Candidatus Handelsmanbacteria bacterium RIFCSPLOWO2_12_FULL_64_10]|uniref:Glycosyltransferase 2-like domain-containing protein n=1 Tax=Handelsmanbacteria sp. (strain RIFCSPLOWO2_12_FULL_64_10) TaxID=1817868 RepID=A0A1F6C582_HANXR|nr:MAG: hypothetical protein A3F84_14865 [Candidatus Handelsmanbacteria bacterium RIFCSPLOWO2_12_FULL_64_10]